ncbi:protein-disulfide isomerase, partial [Pseudomonas aeruginosa]
VIRDNQTGRSVKLEGMADETTLLSAIDWLIHSGD